ncbi:hypothetical protein EJ08DRAFT_698620 [Tothia fuscella]|uniref:Uncharacterized protein n=1 Tax=Tothia fuscella TaxID=1048955 RepID=A0A9P4NNF3_9PEZI|nr:hypothetical protein EJ08DRAFT_698620 [Tothia fuscella]
MNGPSFSSAASQLPPSTAENPSTTNLDMRGSMDAVGSSYPKSSLRSPPDKSCRSNSKAYVASRPQPSYAPESTVTLDWPEVQDSAFFAQSSSFPEVSSRTDISGNWILPGCMVGSSAGNSADTFNSSSYQSAFALNDPMSTLWNLNAWTEG